MLFAPSSEAVTKGVANSKQQIQKSRVPSGSIRGLSLFLFLALLPASPWRAQAQAAAPQFDDLSARAAAARDQGNLPLAIELYGQAEQLKPDWAEGWFYLGLLQYSSNTFPAAIDAFNHLLQIQPNAPPALALRGLCEFETAAYDDSLRDLEKAVRQGAANDPHNEQIIRYHYAQLLARAGRFQDALLQYQFFAVKNISNPDLLLGLGLAGMRVTTLPKDIAQEDWEIYQAAGAPGFVFLSGDSQGADALFNQLFARFPSTPNVHFFYGVLLFSHSPELAIDQFRKEVAIAPGNAEAHAILSYSLMFADRFIEAIPEAELALAGAPDMEMAQIALGRSLAETGDAKRAADLLSQVLKQDPDNLEAHMGLAVLYSRTGRREEAHRERMLCFSLQK